MKKLEDVILQQKDFIQDLKSKTNEFINSLDKTHLQTILLSGSVSRKDYFPGEMGGMVDLTVVRKQNSNASAESVFGKDEEPHIPYHCVTKMV